MPPYLAIPYFHLSKLPISTKIALTCFYCALLAAFSLVAFYFFPIKTKGLSSTGTFENFAKEKQLVSSHIANLNEMLRKGEISQQEYEEGIREGDLRIAATIERVVHPHSLIMPVVFFILVHLFEMTSASLRFKATLYILSFIFMMFVIYSPLMVWLATPIVWAIVPAVFGMLICFSLIILFSLGQMWFAKVK